MKTKVKIFKIGGKEFTITKISLHQHQQISKLTANIDIQVDGSEHFTEEQIATMKIIGFVNALSIKGTLIAFLSAVLTGKNEEWSEEQALENEKNIAQASMETVQEVIADFFFTNQASIPFIMPYFITSMLKKKESTENLK